MFYNIPFEISCIKQFFNTHFATSGSIVYTDRKANGFGRLNLLE